MSIWQRLKRWRTGLQQNRKFSQTLGDPLPQLIPSDSNAQENRASHNDSLAVGLPYDPNADELYQNWSRLSRREQDVTALTCLRYTDDQIAARLSLSKGTVRTYIDKVFIRLGIQSKADLRVMFANWDFSEWERRKPGR